MSTIKISRSSTLLSSPTSYPDIIETDIAIAKSDVVANKIVALTFESVKIDDTSDYGWVFKRNESRPLLYDIRPSWDCKIEEFLSSFFKKHLGLNNIHGLFPILHTKEALGHLESYFGVKFITVSSSPFDFNGNVINFIYIPEGQQNFCLL